MDPTICQAIKEMKLLTFTYNRLLRTVEPHAYGISSTDDYYLLRCYQVPDDSDAGTAPGWQVILTDNITGLTLSSDSFSSPRSGYEKGDKSMSIIFCQL